MDAATRQYAPGDLRVSDADRDRAVAELSEHFQAGRLTLEEFDERSGQALQAKTARDLTGLFADLPAGLARSAGTGDLRGAVAVPGARPPLLAARAVVAAVAILAVAIVVSVLARTGLAHHLGVAHRGFGLPLPVLFVLFFVVRRLAWARSRRRGGPPDATVQDR
jgi:hypothetical protein